MENQNYKFAILVDSGCDVPEEYIQKYPIYVIPLKMNYHDRSYRDRIDISPDEVYARLEEEIPKTSLPSYEEVKELYEQIIKDGYDKIFVITISSSLSGTHNLIRLVSEEYAEKGIQTHLYDTKNIAIASGLYAVAAARHLAEGKEFVETIQTMNAEYGNSKVFFCIETLEYLRKGGRIGHVASMLGSVLGIKPIISCGEDGTYYIAGKERGTNRCVQKAATLAKEFADKGKKAEFKVMCSGKSKIPLPDIKEKLEQMMPGSNIQILGQISPVLGVHVGPGLIGIAVYVSQ